MHTNEEIRTPPPRRFENYILTRVVDSSVGLTSIREDRFLPCDEAWTTADRIGGPFQLGFDFSFDGRTYKDFYVSDHGWMVLQDPTISSFAHTHVLSSSMWFNHGVKTTGFTYNHVLLAPWFDDSHPVLSDQTQLNTFFDSTRGNRIATGLEPPPTVYSTSNHGARYCQDASNPKGRRTIIRWSSISNYYGILNASSVLHFEVVIYENGTIEYRYSPRATIIPLPNINEGATIGIFMPEANRFRDFSAGLGYRDGSRREHIYGGYEYDSTFIDTVPPEAVLEG